MAIRRLIVCFDGTAVDTKGEVIPDAAVDWPRLEETAPPVPRPLPAG